MPFILATQDMAWGSHNRQRTKGCHLTKDTNTTSTIQVINLAWDMLFTRLPIQGTNLVWHNHTTTHLHKEVHMLPHRLASHSVERNIKWTHPSKVRVF